MEKVSVILPVKNGQEFISEALQSVAEQTVAPDEIIVVDGHSSDDSVRIAEGFARVRVLQQPGTGLSNAWNHGIARSRNPLIAFIECDDRWAPDKIERQLLAFADNSSADYIIGKVRFFLQPGHSVPPGFKPELLETDQVGRIPGTLMVKKAVFDRIGTFDETLQIAADVDWFARAKDAGVTEVFLEHVLQHKRVHGANLSNGAEQNTAELLSLLRKSIARQQSGGQD